MKQNAGWADVLKLRDEVVATDGRSAVADESVKAVYQTVPVPYAKVDYYADITQPTPRLVGFLGRVARRLGVTGWTPRRASTSTRVWVEVRVTRWLDCGTWCTTRRVHGY